MTKEQLKTVIVAHLQSLIAQSAAFDEYTIAGISKVFPDENERVAGALAELIAEKSVLKHFAQFEVYLPNTNAGKKIAQNIAKSGFLTFSPYWTILFGFVFFYLATFYYPYPLKPPEDAKTLSQAYVSN